MYFEDESVPVPFSHSNVNNTQNTQNSNATSQRKLAASNASASSTSSSEPLIPPRRLKPKGTSSGETVESQYSSSKGGGLPLPLEAHQATATITTSSVGSSSSDSAYQSQSSTIEKPRRESINNPASPTVPDYDFDSSIDSTFSSSSIDETTEISNSQQHKQGHKSRNDEIQEKEGVNNIKQQYDQNANTEDNDKRNPLSNNTRKKSLPQLLFSASDSLSLSSPPNLPIISTTSVFSSSSSSSSGSRRHSSVEFDLGSNSQKNNNSNMMKLIKKGTATANRKSVDNNNLSKLNNNHNGHGQQHLSPVTGGNEKLLVLLKSDVNHNNTNTGNSHNSSSLLSAEENFECYADGTESIFDSPNPSENTSLQFLRDGSDLSRTESPGGSNSSAAAAAAGGFGPGVPFRRNTLLRSSLRNKSPQHTNNGDMGHRRWGSFRNTSGTKRPLGTSTPTSSNALATQLYRTSSFNSTGRSSTGDPEEMYSDGSLEDEVIDLTQKVHHLEEKFTVLAESQSDVDDRYTRAKQENSELSTKLFLLEEQLRDVEQRADDKLRDEQKRYKELLARLEREKQLQIENYDIRLHALEKELEHTKSETTRQKQLLERERQEKIQAGDKLVESEREVNSLRDDNRLLQEQSRKERENLVLESAGSQQALQELKKEFEILRRFQMTNAPKGTTFNQQHRDSLDGDIHDIKSRLLELEEENRLLKNQNKRLEEANEELAAQILNHGLEEGRHLLTLGPKDVGNSLAAEFEAMSEEQMKAALKEQQEVNFQLRNYIDGILLNIVENYPQLLEVKHKSNPEREC